MPPEYLNFWNNFVSQMYMLFCIVGLFLISGGFAWLYLLILVRQVRNELKKINARAYQNRAVRKK